MYRRFLLVFDTEKHEISDMRSGALAMSYRKKSSSAKQEGKSFPLIFLFRLLFQANTEGSQTDTNRAAVDVALCSSRQRSIQAQSRWREVNEEEVMQIGRSNDTTRKTQVEPFRRIRN